MKRGIIFSFFLIIVHILVAQDNSKGDIVIGFSVGPCFANFINSEVPHKINIYGSDVNPVLFPSSDLTKSLAYTDYQTSLINNILFGISTGLQMEYFLNSNTSIKTGLFYEPKGINLNFSNTKDEILYTGTSYVNGSIAERYKIKINNNYLTVPVIYRKYIFQNQKIFVEGGAYLSFLISSKINDWNEKIVSNDTAEIYRYWSNLDNWKDSKKVYTKKFDMGLSIGTGFEKNLTDKLVVMTEILLNVGLLDVDSKYNNEYSVTPTAAGSNFTSVLVRSTNYYGLNSNSKNINLLFTIGIGYKL